MDRSSSSSSNASKRKVSFAPNELFLVPTRKELLAETQRDILWYDDTNIAGFKRSATDEVKGFMKQTGIYDVRKVFKFLYQPTANDLRACVH